jgi:methylglutaconyl-CoA hydratase
MPARRKFNAIRVHLGSLLAPKQSTRICLAMSHKPHLPVARQLIRFQILRSRYSTGNASLITVTNLEAPNNGHIRILELNRPAARNAISGALLSQLRAEVDAVQEQYNEDAEELAPRKLFGGAAGMDRKGPTRALILASAVDACFCAGADLKERRGFTKEECVFMRVPRSIGLP